MNTFPLEFSKHVIFCVIGVLFFVLQYFRQGYKYQLITAAAILGTMLLYVNQSDMWRYGVGIFEAILIVIIFIVMSVEKKKAAAAEQEKTDKEKDQIQEEKEADEEKHES